MKINEIRSSERASPAIFLQATSHLIFFAQKILYFQNQKFFRRFRCSEGGGEVYELIIIEATFSTILWHSLTTLKGKHKLLLQLIEDVKEGTYTMMKLLTFHIEVVHVAAFIPPTANLLNFNITIYFEDLLSWQYRISDMWVEAQIYR